ncbi:Uncharacterized protein FKW44_022932 [Caligus rogercresseyi]|uniref:Double-stranded RNA-specific editase 1 n=1 Tax=Caligus rogercresseyi TaxID=217165 RepID=A0A7T8GNB1_CALRO|nr:Uncharacterized protein FKW44_022932 [Caligus rogercresseyi]
MFPPPKAPQYKVLSQTGPPNNPTFTMMCTIESNSYVGEGKSKKEAKLVSSQKAIEVLCGYKQTETRSVPERSNPRANCDLDDWMELEGKNPVSILNELYPGIQYQLLSTTGPSHAPNFIIKAILNNMSFEVQEDAKLNASKALLVHLHKVGFDPMTGDMMSTRDNNDAAAIGHTFADRISQLVHYKYQELFGTTTYSKRRVMAAIVMTQDNADGGESDSGSGDEEVTNCPTVIAVSSGTKCINGEQISLEGCVVNDSHAEIVARRCLLLSYTHIWKSSHNKRAMTPFSSDLRMRVDACLRKASSFISSSRRLPTNGSSKKEDKVQVDSASESGGKNLDENNNQIVNWEVSDETKSEPRWTNDNSTAVPSMDENEIIKQDGENMAKNCHITSLMGMTCQKFPIVDENNNVIGEVMKNNVIGEVDENNNPRTTSDESSLLPLDATDSLSDQEEGQKEEQMLLIVPERAESMKTSSSSTGIEKKSNDSSRGMLRSKIECGMGTVPISPKIQIQTWDGVMSGDRLLTMACSDKLLRWNVLGVQGACLTHLIDPIYFSTITVGSKFHPGKIMESFN